MEKKSVTDAFKKAAKVLWQWTVLICIIWHTLELVHYVWVAMNIMVNDIAHAQNATDAIGKGCASLILLVREFISHWRK